jgi:hypothetical protein
MDVFTLHAHGQSVTIERARVFEAHLAGKTSPEIASTTYAVSVWVAAETREVIEQCVHTLFPAVRVEKIPFSCSPAAADYLLPRDAFALIAMLSLVVSS